MDKNDRTVALVLNSVVNRLKPRTTAQKSGTDEPIAVFLDLSKKVEDAILQEALNSTPEGTSQELVDKLVDEFVENAKQEMLKQSLGGRSLEDVSQVIYLHPVDGDHLANARFDWLVGQLPKGCSVVTFRIGDNGEPYIDDVRFAQG